MNKYLTGCVLIVCDFFYMHPSIVPTQQIQSLQFQRNGCPVKPIGFSVGLKYGNAHDTKTTVSLCQNCEHNCIFTKGYSGSDIDQFVFAKTINKFIISLVKEKSIHDRNGLLMALSIMDSYDLEGTQHHVRKLCNGDYTSGPKPLHWVAGRHKKTDAAQIFIDCKATLNIVDDHKNYPLDYAVQGNNPVMTALIMKNGGKANNTATIRKLIETRWLRRIILPNPKI